MVGWTLPALSRAIFRHGARTAIIPVATLLSYSAVLLFTGAVFTGASLQGVNRMQALGLPQ